MQTQINRPTNERLRYINVGIVDLFDCRGHSSVDGCLENLSFGSLKHTKPVFESLTSIFKSSKPSIVLQSISLCRSSDSGPMSVDEFESLIVFVGSLPLT